MLDPGLLERIGEFVGAVGERWAFWIGLLLTLEPYIERAAPATWEVVRKFLATKPDRRKKIFRAAGALALATGVFQAWDQQRAARVVAETKVVEKSPAELQKRIEDLNRQVALLRSPYWEALPSGSFQNLYLRLQYVDPKPITINCHLVQCKDLFNGLFAAFEMAGWTPTRQTEATIDAQGTGIYLAPKDDGSVRLKEIIEATTPLKVRLSPYTREIDGIREGYRLVIGLKPVE